MVKGRLRRFLEWLGDATIMDPDPRGEALGRAMRDWREQQDREAYKRGVADCVAVVKCYADLPPAMRIDLAYALSHLDTL